MLEYIVKITQRRGEVSYYKKGAGGIYNKDRATATRFPGYYAAVKYMSDVLYPGNGGLAEPVTITIEPVAEDRPWTAEEILIREG